MRGVIAGGMVQLAIADDGDGHTPDELARLYRAGGHTGLAIARGIIEAHGGALHASCTPGHGSTFVLALPLRRG